MNRPCSSFDDWFHEQEGYAIRSERFDGDVDWLKAAFEAGLSQAFDECAKIAEWYADTNSEFLPEEVVIACGQTAMDISQAIRHHSQKRGDK